MKVVILDLFILLAIYFIFAVLVFEAINRDPNTFAMPCTIEQTLKLADEVYSYFF